MKKILVFACVLMMIVACKQHSTNEVLETKSPIKVKVYQIQKNKNDMQLKYSGTIEACQKIPLTFQVSGIVNQVYVKEGDYVKNGQLLAAIDKSDYENIYNASLAKYQQAKDAYERLKSVYEQGSLTEIKWVEINASLEQARSSMEIAKNNLSKCNLTAPTDGYIGRRNIEPGQSSIGLSTAPIELVKLENIYVKISVPENEINLIRMGLKASFVVSAVNNNMFTGEVNSISPVADILSRTYTVKILSKNKDLILKPGMVCDVTLTLNAENTNIFVPYISVTSDDNGKQYVYVVDTKSKKAYKRYINTGKYNDSMIEINSGLSTGETIVTEGKDKLKDSVDIVF